MNDRQGMSLDVTQELPSYMRLAEAAQEVVQLGNRVVNQLSQNGEVDPDLLRWYREAKQNARDCLIP